MCQLECCRKLRAMSLHVHAQVLYSLPKQISSTFEHVVALCQHNSGLDYHEVMRYASCKALGDASANDIFPFQTFACSQAGGKQLGVNDLEHKVCAIAAFVQQIIHSPLWTRVSYQAACPAMQHVNMQAQELILPELPVLEPCRHVTHCQVELPF